TCSTMLRPVPVSRLTETTVPTRQLPTTGLTRPRREGSRGSPVPLLLPGVAVEVVAVLLPEPGLVELLHREPVDPLRALPEVQVRHEQPGGAAVLRIERLPVVLVGDPRLAV